MRKHSTPMNQKAQKEWADVMQQFEVPAANSEASDGSSDEEDGSHSKSKSAFLGISVAVALSAAVGMTALHSTNQTTSDINAITPRLVSAENIEAGADKIKSKEPYTASFVSIKNIVNNDEKVNSPRYETIVKDFPMDPLATLAADDNNANSLDTDDANWRTYKVTKEKKQLHDILSRVGISKKTLKHLQENKVIKAELSKLDAGYIIRTQKSEEGKLTQLITHEPGSKESFIASLDEDGSYETKKQRRVVETRERRVTIFIKNSLRFDANQEGLPRQIVDSIAKIFDRDVKLTRDLKKGDRLTLVYEEVFHNGNRIADGNVLAAELLHKKRIHRAIGFNRDGKTEYYDDQGYDLSNAFRRHPLASYKRISSGYGMRRHPIAKRIRMHTGVDFAAPKGTPVYATGNGIVKHVARKGGYGKTVIIEHNGGYSTLYGHLSRYGQGLRPGQKVYIGDKIGYVGSTGASTGNHLHYEFRINGKPQNPLTVKLPKGLSLTSTDRKKFKEDSHNLIRQLDVLQRFAEQKVDIATGIGG